MSELASLVTLITFVNWSLDHSLYTSNFLDKYIDVWLKVKQTLLWSNSFWNISVIIQVHICNMYTEHTGVYFAKFWFLEILSSVYQPSMFEMNKCICV